MSDYISRDQVEEAAEAALNNRDEAIVNVFESTADVDMDELIPAVEGDAESEENKNDA